MKKTQIWLTIILFCISFFNTVIADEEPDNTLQKNNEINVRSLNIHLSKAKIFMKNNKDDKALFEIEKVLELAPSNTKALEMKTQIIGKSIPEKEELKNNIKEVINETENQVDYIELAKQHWLIITILFGSFFAIIIILITTNTNKNKSKNHYDDYDSTNEDKKDPFSELEDVF